MKTFELIQKLKKEQKEFNVIFQDTHFHIVRVNGNNEKREVINERLVTYGSLDELKQKSTLFNSILPVYLITVNGTDAGNYKIVKI